MSNCFKITGFLAFLIALINDAGMFYLVGLNQDDSGSSEDDSKIPLTRTSKFCVSAFLNLTLIFCIISDLLALLGLKKVKILEYYWNF